MFYIWDSLLFLFVTSVTVLNAEAFSFKRLPRSQVVLCLLSPFLSILCIVCLYWTANLSRRLRNPKAILGIDAALVVLTGRSHRSFSQMDECQHVRPSFGGACLGGGWGVEVNGGEAEGLERILST